MPKIKGPTWAQVGAFKRRERQDIVERDCSHYMGRGEHGLSTIRIVCPFCEDSMDAYIWSFASTGKRCLCGAIISNTGGYHFAELVTDKGTK